MEAPNNHRTVAGRWFQRAGTLVVLTAISSMMIAGSAMTASPWNVDIQSAVRSGFTVTIAGEAFSPAGQASGNWLEIDWDDGTVDTLPNFVGSGPWSWGPVDHTYADEGSYTITATLLHASPNGNDRNAQDTEAVVIADPDGGDDEVDVQVSLGTCTSDGETSATPVTATFSGDGGATVLVRDAEDNVVATFTDSGSEQLSPGSYTYTVTADEGSELAETSDTGGPLEVTDCTPVVSPQGSVQVTVGSCDSVDGESRTPVTIAIAPEGAAVVTLSDGADFLRTVTADEQLSLAPGDYTWTATPGEGFELTGATAGTFTTDSCPSIVLGGDPQTPSTGGSDDAPALPKNLATTGPALPGLAAMGVLMIMAGAFANASAARRGRSISVR